MRSSKRQPQPVQPEPCHIRIKNGKREVEIGGPRDFVEQHAAAAIKLLGEVTKSRHAQHNDVQLSLPWGDLNQNEPSAETESSFAILGQSAGTESQDTNIVEYWSTNIGARTLNQREATLIIAHFAQKVQGRAFIDSDYVREAVAQLSCIPVVFGHDQYGVILDALRREKLLHRPARGQYALTVQIGEPAARALVNIAA